MNKIRVGIIRCDLHAIYYGALMDKHDPLLLREPELGLGGHFYFYTYYANPRRITVPTVGGFKITKLWDEDRRRAENMSRIFFGKPRVCDTFEEVSDGVDMVYIADCNGDGSDHLKLAAPGLKKRVPTFVDKPFAYDVKDARAIIRLAVKHRTPVMSLSMLREVPHATRFRSRFAELGRLYLGAVNGGGHHLAGRIHSISLAQHLFSAGVKSVECMGDENAEFIHLDYEGNPARPRDGVILCASGGGPHCAFRASAFGEHGAVHSPDIGDFEFPYGAARILQKAKKMVSTCKPQASYEEMVECVAIATAARRSRKKRKKVCLRDV